MQIKANYYSLSPRRFIGGTKNSFGVETLSFDFSAEWDGLGKTVTFFPVSGEPVVAVYGSDPIPIPAEVFTEAGLAEFTLCGQKNGKTLISVTGYIDILDAKTPGGNEPVEPTPSEMAQVLSLMNAATDAVAELRKDAEDGAFNGAGVPLGGIPGQVLIKKTTADFDASWSYDAGKLFVIEYVSTLAPSLWGTPESTNDTTYGLWFDKDTSDGNGVGYRLCTYDNISKVWNVKRDLLRGDYVVFAKDANSENFEAIHKFTAGEIWQYVLAYNAQGASIGMTLAKKQPSATASVSAYESVVSIYLENNGEYRQLRSPSSSSIFSIRIPAIGSAAANFRAVVYYTAASALAPSIVNSSGYELRFSGLDVLNNIFTPCAGTRYKMLFEFDGIYLRVSIS